MLRTVGFGGATAVVAGLTAASGVWVAFDLPAARRAPRRAAAEPVREVVAS